MAVKVAEEWLNICGGCEVSILDIGEPLLDLLPSLEFVHMPVIMDHKYFGQTGEGTEMEIPEADVGIISGGVRSEKEQHVAEAMRKSCKTLIALGACACHGGIPAMANMSTLEDLYEKGLELNEMAKELNPDYKISTMLNLVTYYGNTDQKDKVPPLFEEAIKEEEGLKSLYASFIVRLEIEDKYDYAIEMMEAEAAKDENARSSYIWFYLGQLHEKKGDKETALTHMRKAAELSPGATYYSKHVERLEKELQEK